MEIPVAVTTVEGNAQDEESDENDADQHHVDPEIRRQAAADAAQHLAGRVTVEPLLAFAPRVARNVFFFQFRIFVRLDGRRFAQGGDDLVDLSDRSNAVVGALFVEQFRHPFLDAFHDLRTAFPLGIVVSQFVQVLLDDVVGLYFERKGISADTYFFNFCHCFKVLMVSTKSPQEESITLSSVQPSSLIP